MDADQRLCGTHHHDRHCERSGRPFRDGNCRAESVMVRRAAIVTWIVLLAAAGLFMARLHIDTDMTAFLPRSASPAQRVLIEQFRDGVVSRLVLVAIEGVPADRSSTLSKLLARR